MIKVLSVVEKTAKTGRPYKALEVESAGSTYKVNVFSDAPDFENIKMGSFLDGQLSKNGDYWNIKFEGQPRGGAPSAFKQTSIATAQKNKSEMIEKAQDNKEHSIKVASTMRMAVDLAIAEYRDETVLDTLEQSIKKWREYCWTNWDADDKDFQAF